MRSAQLSTLFAVSSAVVNLVADSMGNDDTLVISWELPVTPNGAITNYSINIINLKDGSAVRQENTLVETLSVTQTADVLCMVVNTSRTWSSLQCEYCSSEQGRSRKVQCVYLLHKRIRYDDYYYINNYVIMGAYQFCSTKY